MNHYCTYFDRGFLIQGVALARSLARCDREAVLWVLALDDFTADAMRELGGLVRVVTLAELEAGDSELAAAKGNRSRVEYYFTLSPCWPCWLLKQHAEIERITYLDADLFFFADFSPALAAMDAARASVMATAHRFPDHLRHYEQHGVLNVGVLSFRNDAVGRECLEDWRRRCLAWCHDRLEDGKYADQKYLDVWPAQYGSKLLVLDHAGVNLAPWNWARHRCEMAAGGGVCVDGQPLIVFHFARFRPVGGDRWWESGQLDYGVMPARVRQAIYGPYWFALTAARSELAALRSGFDFPKTSSRGGRAFWRRLPLATVFGGRWLRVGNRFFNLRAGLGRWSGRTLAAFRAFRR